MRKLLLWPVSYKDNRLLELNSIIARYDELYLHFFIDREENHPMMHEQIIELEQKVKAIHFHYVNGKNPLERMESLKNILTQIIRNDDLVFKVIGYQGTQFSQLLEHECLQTYPSQVTLISKDGDSLDRIAEVPAIERMYDLNFYHHIHELILSGNYDSAKKILQSKLKNKEINQLLDFAHDLLSLEIKNESNFTLLMNVLKKQDAEDEEIAYIHQMRNLKRHEQKEFIHFIYNYAFYLYRTDDLIDFVVLYYRLAEESLLYAIGWDYLDSGQGHVQFIKRKGSKYHLDFPNWKLNRYFHHYLKALKQEIRAIESRYQGVKIRRDRTTGLEKLTDKERYFVKIYFDFNNKQFQEFLELRHEGVSGHGFADFTKEKFIEVCGGVSPLEKIKPILEELDLIPDYSLFGLIQKAVLGLVREEMDN